MKAWRGRDEVGPGDPSAGSVGRPDAGSLADLADRGLGLDPRSDRTHRHGDVEPPGDHVHPHAHGEPGDRPGVGIVGAGAAGTALGVALSRGGWPVLAVASRDAGRRARFMSLVPGARAFAEPGPLLDEVDVIVLAVPDDAIAPLAAGLRMYGGQAMVHTSGALDADVLEPARAAGTQVGSFHPLVAFADVELAVAALRGATVAVEGDDDLMPLLAEMAATIGANAVRLESGTKAAYHAAAMLAAGGFVALLEAIARLGSAAGLDEAGSLAVYGRLAEQTLANARALGVAAALTGPVVRGDAGTVGRHLEALARLAPDVLPLYRALAEREIAIAESRGVLAPDAAHGLRARLAGPG